MFAIIRPIEIGRREPGPISRFTAAWRKPGRVAVRPALRHVRTMSVKQRRRWIRNVIVPTRHPPPPPPAPHPSPPPPPSNASSSQPPSCRAMDPTTDAGWTEVRMDGGRVGSTYVVGVKRSMGAASFRASYRVTSSPCRAYARTRQRSHSTQRSRVGTGSQPKGREARQ